jgi:large subunit ribosomal protein L2
MSLKFYKPTTPSLRHCINQNLLLKKFPTLKSEFKILKSNAGRNNKGRITVFSKGSGHKKRFRNIVFTTDKIIKGIVLDIEYDPNRTGHIAAVYDYLNKTFCYILAPLKLKRGDLIEYGNNSKIKLGNKMPLSQVPVGSFIYNVDISTDFQVSKSAGTFSILLEKTAKYCKIKLSSGEIRSILPHSMVSLGITSNELKSLTVLGKAGKNRWIHRKPKVRGVAMNPIDHPHGGGEGKTSGGKLLKTPWGKPTKGIFTSRSTNKFIIQKNGKK